MRGVGMCIALAERYSNRFLDYAALEQAELAGGKAALAALARVPLKADPSVVVAGAAAQAPVEGGVKYVWEA